MKGQLCLCTPQLTYDVNVKSRLPRMEPVIVITRREIRWEKLPSLTWLCTTGGDNLIRPRGCGCKSEHDWVGCSFYWSSISTQCRHFCLRLVGHHVCDTNTSHYHRSCPPLLDHKSPRSQKHTNALTLMSDIAVVSTVMSDQVFVLITPHLTDILEGSSRCRCAGRNAHHLSHCNTMFISVLRLTAQDAVQRCRFFIVRVYTYDLN